MKKIITILENEEYLRQISTSVDFENDNYIEYINDLKEYCINNKVYALSPVQIGIPKRIIYMKNTTQDMSKNSEKYTEDIVFINPKIFKMEGHTKFLEGCQSCMPYFSIVDRPYSIEVEYYNLNREKIVERIEGFKATVFCHEYDHLDGILHLDRGKNKIKLTGDEVRKYREEHPYEVISKDCDFNYNDMK